MEFELIKNRCNLIQYTWVLTQHHSDLADLHTDLLNLRQGLLHFQAMVFETQRARVSDPLGLLCVIAVEWNSPKTSPAQTVQRGISCMAWAEEHIVVLWGRAHAWEPCRMVVNVSFSLFNTPGACLLSTWSEGLNITKFLSSVVCVCAAGLGQTVFWVCFIETFRKETV